MDWIKQNRFLAGYLAVVVAGVLCLGAFAFLSWKGYTTTKSNYDTTESQLSTLEKRKVFPNEENLRERRDQVTAYAAAVDSLQAKAAKLQRPLKAEFTERQFRELMGQEADAVAALAAASNLAIPEEFGLGMESYRAGTAVNPTAVPLLEWEMAGIKRFVGLAAAVGVESIDDFRRDTFAQEDKDWDPEAAKKAAEEAAAEANRARRASGRRSSGRTSRTTEVKVDSSNPMSTAGTVMETYRFSAKITSSHDALQKLLNSITNDEEYLYWLRNLRVENVKKRSPTRSEIPDPIPVEGVEPGPDGEVVMEDAFVLFGTEKMKAHLLIDIVRFQEPPRADAPSNP